MSVHAKEHSFARMTRGSIPSRRVAFGLICFGAVFGLVLRNVQTSAYSSNHHQESIHIADASWMSLPSNARPPVVLAETAPQRQPFASAAVECPERSIQDLRRLQILKSQDGEDIHLLETFFHGLCNGTYVEMGALNGKRFSNSYVFNKGFNWKGVLVELGPYNYKQLVVNRPNELAVVHAAVCGERRKIHYYEKGAVGGVWEFSEPKFRELWWNVTIDKTKEIDCLPLDDLFTEHVGDHFYFDFFSLDIEGAELEALKSIDFDKHRFGVIFVEGESRVLGPHAKNMQVRQLLEDNGYVYYHTTKKSLWFVHKDIRQFYGENVPVPRMWRMGE